jgi:PleD family two-component response regulator
MSGAQFADSKRHLWLRRIQKMHRTVVGVFPPVPLLPSILIVDDSHDSANTLRSLFGAYGYKTYIAYDGVAALEAATAQLPDVILLDHGIPEIDGVHVAHVALFFS